MTATQSQQRQRNGHRRLPEEATPYGEAVLGFTNYWYPVFTSREVRKKPVALTLLGDHLVFIRGQKDGKVYAMSNECAHRGTRLSAGRGCEFPGTNTITCPYHGWTYDLETGMCVAVLPEGPQSQVPGKIRMKTYPVEERKGIVWVWMGDMAPVPLEEDVPNLLLRGDTIVKVRNVKRYGNWRWHVENVQAGHAVMIHRDSLRMLVRRPRGGRIPDPPEVAEDYDGVGVDNGMYGGIRRRPGAGGPPSGGLRLQPDQGLVQRLLWGRAGPPGQEFPSLGRWYVVSKAKLAMFWPWHRFWFGQSSGAALKPVKEDVWTSKWFLPGIFRQPHHPSDSDMYYEWYPAIDEDHYIYFQVTCMWGRNPLHRLWKQLWYYVWGRPTGIVQFNDQDVAYVKETTDFTKRNGIGIYPLVKLSRNDDFHALVREFANQNARGVGYAWRQESGLDQREEPVSLR